MGKDKAKIQEMPGDCSLWEAEKILFIFRAVKRRFGWDMWGSSYTGVNPSSGYAYVWSEDYPVSFYMPINCDLTEADVYALWTNSENGDEHEAEITLFSNDYELHEWVAELEKGEEEE